MSDGAPGGQVALVTGGSRGPGKEFARALAEIRTRALSIIPLIVAFLFLQRYRQSGLASGAVNG